MLPECTRDPEGLALLQKCKENPDDIAPRLILADWLEEKGEIEISRIFRSWISPESYVATSSINLPQSWSAFNLCLNGWFGAFFNSSYIKQINLNDLCTPWLSDLSLSIRENIGEFMRAIGPLLSNTHIVNLSLNFYQESSVEQFMNELRKFKRLKNIHTLFISFSNRDPDNISLSSLSQDNFFENVQRLDFPLTITQASRFQTFLNSSLAHTVRELKIGSIDFSNPAIPTIFSQSQYLRNLRKLFLCFLNPTPENIRIFGESKFLENIRDLNITFSNSGTECLSELISSSYLYSLDSLNLHSSGIEYAGIADLASSNKFNNLQSLLLRDNLISDVGCFELAFSPYLNNLTTLDLTNNNIGSAGTISLSKTQQLNNLSVLALNRNNISDGLCELANSNSLPKLKNLCLYETNLSEDAIADLFTSKKIRQLSNINLAGNQIPFSSFTRIFEGEPLPNMEDISLGFNHDPDCSIEYVLQCNTKFPNLKSLFLSDLAFSTAGITVLKQWAERIGVRLHLKEN